MREQANLTVEMLRISLPFMSRARVGTLYETDRYKLHKIFFFKFIFYNCFVIYCRHALMFIREQANLTVEDVEDIIYEADKDGDGHLTFDGNIFRYIFRSGTT